MGGSLSLPGVGQSSSWALGSQRLTCFAGRDHLAPASVRFSYPLRRDFTLGKVGGPSPAVYSKLCLRFMSACLKGGPSASAEVNTRQHPVTWILFSYFAQHFTCYQYVDWALG